MGQSFGGVEPIELQVTDRICEQASTLVDIDLLGVPSGLVPIRTLAVVVASIRVVISIATLPGGLGEYECDGSLCTVLPEHQETFLELLSPPDGFNDRGGILGASISSIEGLVVE